MDYSSLAKFEYHPLLPISTAGNPAFRILELQPRSVPPGPDDGPVARRLLDASLRECEPYKTLSYCWGDASVRVPLSLDGMWFEVTTNLYAALRWLRKCTQTRRIWIDAICMNQDDTNERNEQIHHMRRIYSETMDCFVWLGEFNDSTVKLAFKGYSWLKEIREQDISHPEYKDLSIPESSEVMSSITLVSPDALGALKAIVNSPWFRRVWVIQEITSPKTVSLILGYAVLDWDFTTTLLTYGGYFRP
ncbi:heterokaryon incompatibility protein-domain-containing protein [Leptodontidium sp. MPI-SDFR-AT-0119]|nr:heterokaryon incompatibility protein-domain-containing protein [Leptodontidium sp. MPI-SDFR-AT-0119]